MTPSNLVWNLQSVKHTIEIQLCHHKHQALQARHAISQCASSVPWISGHCKATRVLANIALDWVHDHAGIRYMSLPFHCIVFGDLVLNANSADCPPASSYSVAWSLEDNIEVHTYTNSQVAAQLCIRLAPIRCVQSCHPGSACCPRHNGRRTCS